MADQQEPISSRAEEPETSPRRSTRRSGKINLPEVTVSATANPDASIDVSTYDTPTKPPRKKAPTRGGKQRALKPSTLPVLPPPLSPSASTSLLPAPPASSPTSPLPPNPSRRLFSHARSTSKGSNPTDPIKILDSDAPSSESDGEQAPSTAQTTPDPSPKLNNNEKPPEEPRRVRPVSGRRTVSDPTPRTSGSDSGTKSRNAQDIDGDIETKIRSPGTPHGKNKEKGFVYVETVVHIASKTKLIKIGSTGSVAVKNRLKDILTPKCKDTLQWVELPKPSREQHQVDGFYLLVEALAHKELDHFRYDFVCGCMTRHEEYFRLDPEVGHRVVSRWASFSRRAFTLVNGQCQLTAEWKFHLDRFRDKRHDRPDPTKPQESMDDHVSRHKRWESLLASSWWSYCWHKASEVRWQAWSIVLAVWLFFETRTPVKFVLLVLTVVFVYLDSSSGSLIKGAVNYYFGGTTAEDIWSEKMGSEGGADDSEARAQIGDRQGEDSEENT